jgi:hypothetical protein
MATVFFIAVCLVMLIGGFFVAFAEGMADTAGDANATGIAMIVAAIGALGLVGEAIYGAVALVRWLA